MGRGGVSASSTLAILSVYKRRKKKYFVTILKNVVMYNQVPSLSLGVVLPWVIIIPSIAHRTHDMTKSHPSENSLFLLDGPLTADQV